VGLPAVRLVDALEDAIAAVTGGIHLDYHGAACVLRVSSTSTLLKSRLSIISRQASRPSLLGTAGAGGAWRDEPDSAQHCGDDGHAPVRQDHDLLLCCFWPEDVRL
jgi:hypothetical protein